MRWSSDWLYTILFRHARTALDEATTAALKRSEAPPTKILATEHREFSHESNIPSGQWWDVHGQGPSGHLVAANRSKWIS